MKTVDHTDTTTVKVAATSPSPVKICMHLREVARTDRRVLREATALLEEGFAVSIVDVECEQTHPVEEDISGIHMKHMLKPHWLTPTYNLRRLVRSTEKLICSTWTMLQMSADIYHAHDENALLPCYIAALVHRKPLVFDAHELPLRGLGYPRWLGLRTLLTLLFTAIVSRCSGVITVSPPIAQEIRSRYRARRVTVIRNIPAFQAVAKSDRLRQHLGLGPEIRIALYQGNIDQVRQLSSLVRAAGLLERNTVIVLMGKGVGETVSELEALAVKESVADRVKIIPPVPYAELLEWTASADIGLAVFSPDYSLSVRWCLPNKLFEYLMAGLPVLATSLDAVADLLKSYDVGQVVPSFTPVDIAAAINAMLADHAALDRMRRNALKAVRGDLCWEKERQRLIRLYRDILSM